MIPYINKNKILPFNLGALCEFPFINDTFDDITYYEILKKLSCKINEIIKFNNDLIEKKLNEYIVQIFNDMIIDSMYEADTETLVLYLQDSGGGN